MRLNLGPERSAILSAVPEGNGLYLVYLSYAFSVSFPFPLHAHRIHLEKEHLNNPPASLLALQIERAGFGSYTAERKIADAPLGVEHNAGQQLEPAVATV